MDKMFGFKVDFLKTDGQLVKGRDRRICLESGTAGSWILTLRLLKDKLSEGERITIRRYNFQIANNLQDSHDTRRDYVTISHNCDAQIQMTLLGRAHGIVLKVVKGELKKGDRIVIKIGDRKDDGVGSEVFWSATLGRLSVFMNCNGEDVKAAEDMFIDIVCQTKPKFLRLLGATVVDCNELFSVNLVVFDINRNVIDSFTGTVCFDVPQGVSGLPAEYIFTPEDKGVKIFEGVRIDTEGVFRIGVWLKDGNLSTVSNPLICRVSPEERVYWGDLHAHGWGDCTMFLMYDRNWKTDPAARHEQGRRIGRFDYAGPGAMSMPDTAQRDEIWQAYLEAFDINDEPGKYVPFMAMELHPGQSGDRTLIFKDKADIPISSMGSKVEDIYERYGGRNDTILETHIGGVAPYFDEYKPQDEKMVEVASAFGNAEWLLQKMLRNGYHPAVTGASDLHLGLFGAPRAVETFRGRFINHLNVRDSGYGSGPVTAVMAKSCRRDSIWKSLVERNSYATTGDRIYVDLRADGCRMGLIANLPQRFSLKLTVSGQDLVERIDLIAGRYLATSLLPDKLDVCWEMEFDRLKMPLAKWFYFRIKQANSEYAWTAPVWFSDGKLMGDDAAKFKPWNYCEKPDVRDSQEMKVYLEQLEDYLTSEGDRDTFGAIEPVGIVKESMGVSAKFVSVIKPQRYPVTIRLFFEYEVPKIRVDWGYENFGVVDCQRGPAFNEE
ncbi:MAG: DUF3604 domain-containing protein [Planctomycetota bacterium]|jgi:hypothetical protein